MSHSLLVAAAAFLLACASPPRPSPPPAAESSGGAVKKSESGTVKPDLEPEEATSTLDSMSSQDPLPPPPPASSAPKIVPLKALMAQRVSGDPDLKASADAQKLVTDSKQRAIGVFKLCVGATGAPTSTRVVRSTGFASLDGELDQQMSGWRFRPFTINGKPHPICTAVTVIVEP